MKLTLEIDCAKIATVGELRSIMAGVSQRILNPPDRVTTPIHEDRIVVMYCGVHVGTLEVR
jgi:hypothetical protein